MAYEVLMPQLGLTMEEGTVSQWLKKEGDAVAIGEAILEITTDKLTNEVVSEFEGVLLKIVAQEGEDIPVKGLLGYIGQAGEAVGGAAPAAAPKAVAGANSITAPLPGSVVSISVKAGDAVKAGQQLAVIEAMKMENEILAPADGTVAAVHVSAGQAVQQGDALIDLA